MSASFYDSLVILLHGVGANGSDLAPLSAALRNALPKTLFVAPDAPNLFDRGPGHQWFSVVDVTATNRLQRVVGARASFDGTLADEIDRAGLASRLGRVALVGFSQGAIMALDAMATARWPVAGVVAFSGRLASPDPLTPAKGARALLLHGEDDPVIPAHETLGASARLSKAGVVVDCHVAPGLGHAISPEGVARARSFLIEAFAR